MPTYLSPGVYIEEIPSGARPIEGVPTSVTAFVGAAVKGPVGEAVPISSFDDYVATFGEIASESDQTGLAVRAFYLNGGKSAYVARMAGSGAPSAAASDTVTGQDTGGSDVLQIRATSIGTWGNAVYYRIVKPDQDALTFTLEVGHLEKGSFTVDETFPGLSMNEGLEGYALDQVNGNSGYIELVLESAADPDDAAEQYQDATLTGGTLDGAADFFSTGMSGAMTLTLNVNALGARLITVNTAALGLAGADNQADGDSVAAAIQSAVRNLGTDAAYQSFTCSYAGQRFTLTSVENRSLATVTVYDGDGGAADLARLLRLDSQQRATLTGAALDTGNAALFSAGIAAPMTLTLNIDAHGDRPVTLDPATLGLSGTDHNADGQLVATALKNAVQAINTAVPAYKDFDCTYASGQFTLASGSASSRISSLTVTDGPLADLLGLNAADNPTLIAGRQINQGTARVIPQQSLGTLENGIQLTGGGEAPATAGDFGTFFTQTLRKVREVSVIVLPGQHWAAGGAGNPVISQALAHAEATKSRMVIIDPPPGVELEQSAQVDQMALPTSTYSVLYYPWVKVANPFYNPDTNPNAARTLTIAPSAFAAGMWSKIDARRGVWKAPAGVEAQLLGIAGLEYIIEEGEQNVLNPLGVNCYRKMPSFGPVIWGTRTLSTKANPEWRYVPVRRTAIMIERSIYEGIQWAVFEPNDHRLWSSLRANIGAFMDGLFRAGAFQGQKASDAYFVRCGLGDTMTQDDIDRGQVIAVVGFAPLKPAEFVIVRIQQKVAQQ